VDRSKLVSEVTAIHSERCGLLMDKSQDYAGEDVLANFKRMNILCKQLSIRPARSPADCALFLALLKFDRLCNLKNKGTAPKNEAVKDSYIDLLNYLDLAHACELEDKLGKKEVKLDGQEYPLVKEPSMPPCDLDNF